MSEYSDHVRKQKRLEKEREPGDGFLATVARYSQVMDQAAWGTVAGIMDVATYPLAAAIRSTYGGDPTFRGALEDVGEITEAREPQTPGERRAATATEYLVGSVLPIPGAAHAAKAIGPGTGVGRNVARTMLKPFRETPGRAAVAETVAGVGAGTAAGITREAYPDSPSAELAASLAGGLGPGLAAAGTRAVGRKMGPEVLGTGAGMATGYVVGGPGGAAIGAPIGGVGGKVISRSKAGRPEARAIAARAEAKQTMQRSVADPDAARARMDTAEITDVVPDAHPTSAAVSREKGIRTMEADLYRNDPVFASKIDARREQNRVAVRRAFGSTEPDGPTPSETRDIVRRAVDDDLDALDAEVSEIKRKAAQSTASVEDTAGRELTSAQDQVAKSRDSTRRGMSAADASETYYAELSGAAQEFHLRSQQKYITVDPHGRLNLDADSHIGPTARRIVENTRKPEQGSVPQLARIAADYEGPQSYEEILSLRRAVNAELNAATKDPARRGEVRLLTQLKKSVDDTFQDLIDSGNMSTEAESFRDANRYFHEGAKVFRDGQAGKVLEPSRSPIPESATLSKFFIPGDDRGSREAIADFLRTTARMRADGNAEGAVRAERAMHDYIIGKAMDSFESASGKVNPARLQAWLKNHEFALERFPEIRQRLRNVGTAQRLLDETRASAKANIAIAKGAEKAAVKEKSAPFVRQRKDVETNAAALYARMDPDEAIIPAIKNPEVMRKLTGRMGRDPEAMAGLRRAAWRNFRDSSFKGEMGEPTTRFDPKRAKRWLEKNRASMKILYDGSEVKLNRLEKILEAGERMLGDLPAQTRGRISEARSDHRVVDAAWRMTRARAQGGSAAAHAMAFVTDLLEKFPSVGAKDLIEEGILNPEFGAILLTKVQPVTRKSLSARLNSHLARMTREKGIGVVARTGIASRRSGWPGERRETTNRTALP